MTERIYIGGDGRGASIEEKPIIAKHAKRLCAILEKRGYKYYIDKALLDEKINTSNPETKIPNEYYQGISQSLIDKISGLRDENEEIRTDIAMMRWMVATMGNSIACIWLHDRSKTGFGLEIYRAIYELRLYSLVLYSTRSISSLLKGNTSRLLTTRRWKNETVEENVNNFLSKIETHYDRPRRFLLNDKLDRLVEKRAEELGCDGISEYLRELISEDIKKSSIF